MVELKQHREDRGLVEIYDSQHADGPRLSVKVLTVEFPNQLISVEGLTHFELIAPHLTVFPQQILSITSLRYLSLTLPKVTSFPMEILHLPQLSFLRLKRCPLHHLFKSVNEHTSMMTLNSLFLEHCHLQEFPMWTLDLQHLQELSLGHNEIAEIPPDIRRMRGLRRLSLENNHLSQLPIAELSQLPQLAHLSLDGNPLEKTTKRQLHSEFGLWFTNKALA